MSDKITRREVIKRAVYVAPVILTLAAVPAFARGGSEGTGGRWDEENEKKDNGRWDEENKKWDEENKKKKNKKKKK